LVLAGTEGALLRSVDTGKSFHYAFEYPDASPLPYPYVGQIPFVDGKRDLILIGGNDNNAATAYLAYGTKDGTKWTDISHLLGNIVDSSVTAITQDHDGRLLVVFLDQHAK
jgi:hypothetical protein